MPAFIGFLLRLLLVLAGLIFAASLAAAAVLALALWAARAAWARLAGKPISPLIFHFDPHAIFRAAGRRRQPPASRTPRADAVPAVGNAGSVTDVEPKPRKGQAG